MLPVKSKRWAIAGQPPVEIDQALSCYSPILRQVLYNRGYSDVDSADRYLNALPPLDNSPWGMKGVAGAVDRIRGAIRDGELIAVYGDYDADGVTATALLTLALLELGAQVKPYIPNRFDEGYGLNIEALDTLKDGGARLVITVDCGIRSLAEAEHAASCGLDLIISDHHHPGEELPQTIATINPRQPGDAYPDKHLAGVGLAYKLAEALFETFSASPPSGEPGKGRGVGGNTPAGGSQAAQYLDLVALGTIADLAPLVGENRALVRAGLKALRQPARQGIMSLIGVTQLTATQISAENVGFGLAPRLNAAGRLDSALAALELLMTRDVAQAAGLAQKLDNQNRERQELTRQIQAHAEETILKADPEALLLFAVDETYNPGVIGLAASRLCEQYYRPAIVAHHGEEFTRGSCRSIPEFHITRALDECADLLIRHGGHAAAAGFTVLNRDLDELIERLKDITARELDDMDLRPTMKADAQVTLSDLRAELFNDLKRLQPTGHGNPPACLVSRNLMVTRRSVVGKDKSHLKLSVNQQGIGMNAIAFRQGHWYEALPAFVDLMYTFEVNEYNGRTDFQLNVRDLKPAGSPD